MLRCSNPCTSTVQNSELAISHWKLSRYLLRFYRISSKTCLKKVFYSHTYLQRRKSQHSCLAQKGQHTTVSTHCKQAEWNRHFFPPRKLLEPAYLIWRIPHVIKMAATDGFESFVVRSTLLHVKKSPAINVLHATQFKYKWNISVDWRKKGS